MNYVWQNGWKRAPAGFGQQGGSLSSIFENIGSSLQPQSATVYEAQVVPGSANLVSAAPSTTTYIIAGIIGVLVLGGIVYYASE